MPYQTGHRWGRRNKKDDDDAHDEAHTNDRKTTPLQPKLRAPMGIYNTWPVQYRKATQQGAEATNA